MPLDLNDPATRERIRARVREKAPENPKYQELVERGLQGDEQALSDAFTYLDWPDESEDWK